MRDQTDQTQRKASSRSRKESPGTHAELIESEQLLLRNYDHRWGYDLAVEVVDVEGSTVFEQRYYLQPGQVQSELGILSEGEYEVRISMDNLQEETIQCRIGSASKHTVVVEVGNSALSVTEGLRV